MKYRLRYMMSLAIINLALICSIPSAGQVIKGSISGTVTDPEGAVVTGAQIIGKNLETGAVFTTTSDGAGLFRLSLIPVGTYDLQITAQGFMTAENKAVAVTASADTGIGSVALTVGAGNTTGDVTPQAPVIESTQSPETNTFTRTPRHTFSGAQENHGFDDLSRFVPT